MKCSVWIIQIEAIQKGLTDEAAETIAVGIILPHRDHWNVIVKGLSKHEVSRLQRMQFLAARAIIETLMKVAHDV